MPRPLDRSKLVDMQRVANNLYLARIASGLSQNTAASRAGVSNSHISNVESMRSRPDDDLISALAKLYRVRVRDILHARAVITWEEA